MDASCWTYALSRIPNKKGEVPLACAVAKPISDELLLTSIRKPLHAHQQAQNSLDRGQSWQIKCREIGVWTPESLNKSVFCLWFSRKPRRRHINLVDSRRLYCRTPRSDSGANFQWNDSGFGPKVRVTGHQKSKLQTKSQSYSRGRPPESKPNRPEKEPEWGLALLQKTPLKAFLNPNI